MENGKQSAFPIFDEWGVSQENDKGLTKREYFAGLAMQGLMYEFESDQHELNHCENVARKAIRMADELLKQLEKPK